MSTTTLTTARQAAERLAREIRDRDLADLMPRAVYTRTRMPLLIETACATILDARAPDELVCGCGADLADLMSQFYREGMLFETLLDEPVSRMLRKIKVLGALRAAAHELDLVREVLA